MNKFPSLHRKFALNNQMTPLEVLILVMNKLFNKLHRTSQDSTLEEIR
jgi:hypothetical protein